MCQAGMRWSLSSSVTMRKSEPFSPSSGGLLAVFRPIVRRFSADPQPAPCGHGVKARERVDAVDVLCACVVRRRSPTWVTRLFTAAMRVR